MSDPESRIPADTAEATRDLQDRIGRFARGVFGLAAIMLVSSVVSELSMGSRSIGENLRATSRQVHVLAEVVLFVGWRVCRGGRPLRAALLPPIDAALTIVACACWALLGLGADSREPIALTVVLALTFTLMARSVIVPSSFIRTLWISGVATVPTIVFLLLRGMPYLPNIDAVRVRTFQISTSLWCIAAVFIAATNSRTLYGLRERIRTIGKLGQYTLEKKLGEGGMGIVYFATHAMLRRPAAIKLLPPDRADAKDLARFEREVQLTSRLAHPNTVSIFDYGRTADGVFYYVMEYLDGLDLEELVRQSGPLSAPRAVRILAQVSGALSEAHALGLVHRDIKPANIMLTERPDEPDVVKVVDFGLVKTIERSSDAAVTNVNTITGTPMYLAPEAITSPDSIDGRADIYAVGAVAYFLLTGQPVFDGKSILEVCSKHLHQAPIPPSQRTPAGAHIPPELETLVLACLAKRPEDRPPSAGALRTALIACPPFALYDVDDARAWWKARERTRGPGARPRSAGSAPTVAINLRGRELDAAPEPASVRQE